MSFLNKVEMTGQYLLRVARNQHDEPARTVAEFARHGGVVAGVGTMGSYQPRGEKYGIYRLSAFAVAIRVALRTQEALVANPRVSSRPPAGPVSAHLAWLRDCGLVTFRPQGRATMWSLTASREILGVLAAAEHLPTATGNAVALCSTYGEEANR